MRRFIITVLLLSVLNSVTGENCYPKKFNSSSVVCVCNENNCGDIGKVKAEDGKIALYQSSMSGERLQRSTVDFLSGAPAAERDLTVSLINTHLQKIIGFGGALTDAAGVHWAGLGSTLQKRLLQSYYGPEGLEYNMGRIPMAACDFSTRDYTYADTPGDFELKNFALAKEDLELKIPMIQFAKNVSKEEIYFFGSPWGAPAWMKTNEKTYGKGTLKGSPGGQYFKSWANYFVKFYESYKEHGITMWGFTVQNEPTTGFKPWPWQTVAMSPYTERDFLKKDLGPALFKATSNSINIMVLDDNRVVLPWWANVIFSDPEANRYAAGLAVHWYTDTLRNSSDLESIHRDFGDKIIVNTEACEGFEFLITPVILGSWERGEAYARDILEDLRHHVNAWVDWNLFLNTEGGPNWAGNRVDSAIIVDTKTSTFYKQPTYYAIAHFSKFIPRGSVRLDDALDGSQEKLTVVTFLRPDKLKATVILNRNDSVKKVLIKGLDGKSFMVEATARSITTALW
ncbi:lysosomal acid glucosylceramidase [Galendromus occidentalis]|uniref:Glucosylceramidase n=1 Tax=Galendromus occidentalis TaxID=34638 RepID=A0AAJ7L3J2_9ACAR|nr:lysosomal acid glucosylceramidase [Galendromus occidentalis]